jgi:predicted transcriptional regulator of viral defense system
MSNLPTRRLPEHLAKLVTGLEFAPPEQPLSVRELGERFDLPPARARLAVHRLQELGWLRRVRHGFYEFVPAAAVYPSGSPWLVFAGIEVPYLVSGLAAAHELRLTPQLPSRPLVILPAKTRVPAGLADSNQFRIVRQRPWRIVGWEPRELDGVLVHLAQTERVAVDASDHPDWFGGIGEAARILARALARGDQDALVELALSWRSHATVRRIGWWGDRLLPDGWTPTGRRRLLAALPERGTTRLLTGGPTGGRRDSGWDVVVNVPDEVLQMEAAPR